MCPVIRNGVNTTSNSVIRVNFEPLKYLKLVYCGIRGKIRQNGYKEIKCYYRTALH